VTESSEGSREEGLYNIELLLSGDGHGGHREE
jgi:hypothetical protein